MIDGIPLQTDSKVRAIHDFGCYFSTLAAIAQDMAGKAASPELLADVYERCRTLKVWIGDEHRPVIETNNLPIAKDSEWFRCFVWSPKTVIRQVGIALGVKLTATEVYRGMKIYPSQLATYTIIEGRTKIGSHFGLGIIQDENKFIVSYNPDPRLPISTLRSIRHWSVVKE